MALIRASGYGLALWKVKRQTKANKKKKKDKQAKDVTNKEIIN